MSESILEPTTVVIVTEASGRERRYRADEWAWNADPSDPYAERAMVIDILRAGEDVARYNVGAWLSVRVDSGLAPGGAEAALRIAKQALERIAANSVGEHSSSGIARDALDGIFAETE